MTAAIPQLNPWLILICMVVYFAALILIARFTSRQSTNESYFTGNHLSPWFAVAFGMIGDCLSGITFISVPGQVYSQNLYYLQLVFGYFVGFLIISRVLLPLYYRHHLVSIYTYLGTRFGPNSQKAGSAIFIVSRLLGAGVRLYVAASVMQLFLFDAWNIPFELSVAIVIAAMLVYTYRGGIQTLVWTDVLQSGFLLFALTSAVITLIHGLDLDLSGFFALVSSGPHSAIIDANPLSRTFFLKQFLGGILITVAMTGLDQNIIQKNLSCKSLKDAQKNMQTFAFILVFVNLCFLSLGALLYQYVQTHSIALPTDLATGKILTDKTFPTLALQYLGIGPAVIFVIGLTAATFSSADSVLTTLTTAFCFDFLDIQHKSDAEQTRIRHRMHLVFAFILLVTVIAFSWIKHQSLIDTLLTLASFTYGPLLGLFAFGMFTQRKVNDSTVGWVCVLAPILCWAISLVPLGGYVLGYEILLINALITVAGLWIIRKSDEY